MKVKASLERKREMKKIKISAIRKLKSRIKIKKSASQAYFESSLSNHQKNVVGLKNWLKKIEKMEEKKPTKTIVPLFTA